MTDVIIITGYIITTPACRRSAPVRGDPDSLVLLATRVKII